ncbi:MAG TPA: chemotaxis protein CheW [Elusimicrobia bacterium]|jgi:purine-binding chemotaxis protein CheW|nr:chemotaxis protein CheW [Elusimicrobiota bacterium]
METKETQLVVFQLSTEEYGVPIIQVEEIIRIPGITRIPNMPNFIEGVINLRGRIIPIVDLRRRFKLEEKGRNEESRIIIGKIAVTIEKQEEQSVGLIVDSVTEVLRVNKEMVEPIPPTISYIDMQYLNGVVKLENRLIILLDLSKVLTELEKETLKTQISTR